MSFTFSSNYPDYNLNFSYYISLSRESPLESYLLLILVIRRPWKVSKKHTGLPLGKKFYSRRKRDRSYLQESYSSITPVILLRI